MRMPAVPPAKSVVRPVRKILLLCLLAAVAAAFLFLETAWTQDGPEDSYVDIVMLYEYPGSPNSIRVVYSVQNNGTATATGVTVSFLLEDLQAGTISFLGSARTPSITGKETVNTTDQRFTWEVGTLPPGGASDKLMFSTSRHSGVTTTGEVGVINAEASSFSPEPDTLLSNNIKKVYSYFASSSGATLHMRGNKLVLLLSVDNLQPAAGGEVNFDLTARSFLGGGGENINLIADIMVKVELSDGLKFKDSWTRPTGFTTSGRSATWTPEAVDGDDGDNTNPRERSITIEAQLTSGEGQELTDIPLTERCITARVEDSIPPPNPDYALGRLKQCLGEPPVLLEEGSVAFLTSFPCIVDTHTDAHQCESVPGVAVAARLPSRYTGYPESDDFHANLRSHGVGRTDERTGAGNRDFTVFHAPESVFIQVKDPEGRVQDSHTHSVSGVSWQTARQAITGKNRAVDGVTITYTRKDIKDASAWNSLGPRTLTVTRADGTTPGKVKIRLNSSGNQFFDLSSGTATKNAFNITSVSTSVVQYFAEFETLGTYFIEYSLTLTDSSTPTPNAYTDSGRYTFHVGPVAELEVRDGAPGLLPSGQQGFTIEAVNNGPDNAPAAKVTLTGLDADSCAGNATKGSVSYANGECAWTIGELITRDASRIASGRDGEVLTIVTDAISEVTAAISNTQDYEVCIDSSGEDVALTSPSSSACTAEDTTNTWHTTPYYDYISDNNSATIKAKDGTGTDLPSLKSPVEDTASIIVDLGRHHRGLRARGDPLRGAAGDQPLGDGGR